MDTYDKFQQMIMGKLEAVRKLCEMYADIEPRTVTKEEHLLALGQNLVPETLDSLLNSELPGLRAEIVSETADRITVRFYEGEKHIPTLGSEEYPKEHGMMHLRQRLYVSLMYNGMPTEEIAARFPAFYREHRIGEFLDYYDQIRDYRGTKPFWQAEEDGDLWWMEGYEDDLWDPELEDEEEEGPEA